MGGSDQTREESHNYIKNLGQKKYCPTRLHYITGPGFRSAILTNALFGFGVPFPEVPHQPSTPATNTSKIDRHIFHGRGDGSHSGVADGQGSGRNFGFESAFPLVDNPAVSL